MHPYGKMDNIIKQQLQKTKHCNFPEYDDTTTHMIIPRNTELYFTEGKCYVIELQDYLINPSNTFTYHINWNQNRIPTCKWYKCECIRIMGNNIQIDGVGYDNISNTDTDIIWSGWLPIQSIKIVRSL